MSKIKREVKKIMSKTAFMKNILWGKNLYKYYMNSFSTPQNLFLLSNITKFYVQSVHRCKAEQIQRLIKHIDINPVDNSTFFYSIDCFKTVEIQNHILDNNSVDYTDIIKSSLNEKRNFLLGQNTWFAQNELKIIDAMQNYYGRLSKSKIVLEKYGLAKNAINSLFERPAQTFFEGIQRILFFNQFLWQSRHKHNGFGHLDWLLIDLYRNDLKQGRLTEEEGKEYLKDFFRILHEKCWYKSTMLLGDTGQIVILGGLTNDGSYCCNELTYLFIEVSKELKLPDPKILLRCSVKMPDDLLEKGIECIATGIGAPFLSNDDVVIPSLISYGYDKEAAYNYVTAACWEPLILNSSCDQNNIGSINFAEPFVELLDSEEFEFCESMGQVLNKYETYLKRYIKKILSELSQLKFEEDPLISLLSDSAMEKQKDIVRGGAKYSNLGLTSVGLGTVVNSLLNLQNIVFVNKQYSLQEINLIRKQNYKLAESLLEKLKSVYPCFGCDSDNVIELTRHIMEIASEEFQNHKTFLGGGFKYGLSSPNYITDASKTAATFDGRKNHDPFNVHISTNEPLPTSELISFAMRLDYKENRGNGNVVDFIVTPETLHENIDKYMTLLKVGFQNGIFQLQMNVVSSKTLLSAKKDPKLFPNLVVRVWGFSAYFKDLPDEYKDLLIERAQESELAS